MEGCGHQFWYVGGVLLVKLVDKKKKKRNRNSGRDWVFCVGEVRSV